MPESDITILHVDDDEGFSELVASFIQHRYDEITVRKARTGDDALAHLEATDDVDCVVSDYRMPKMNGLELLTAVRVRWPDMPFILFTGQGSEEIAVRAINTGVTDYLQKGPGTSSFTLLANRVRNVVTQHRAERELKRTSRRTEAQFELLVETIEDYAIFLLDEDGYIQTWNAGAERIKGYTSEEVLGEHVSKFYRDEEVEAGIPERHLRWAVADGHVRDEGWRVRKDGSEFWADVTITALCEGDDLLGYANVTRDSTQRHREQLLLEQNEQLEELIAAISHDLRTPLTVAAGNVELTIETGDLSRLERTREAHRRAMELLEYLRTLAKEDKQITEPEPVDLEELCEAAWRAVTAEEATLLVEGTTTLVADRQRLQQLLENLFVNAVEHAGPDVTVCVGPFEDGGFYVEDDGPGIPEAERARVFEMGYSGDPDGSGFGLAICRQIARAHGWFIEVTGGFDGGACFEVTDVEAV